MVLQEFIWSEFVRYCRPVESNTTPLAVAFPAKIEWIKGEKKTFSTERDSYVKELENNID